MPYQKKRVMIPVFRKNGSNQKGLFNNDVILVVKMDYYVNVNAKQGRIVLWFSGYFKRITINTEAWISEADVTA